MTKETKKFVINTCYGGFSLSSEALKWLRENGYEGQELDEYTFADGYNDDLDNRSHPLLIKCIETLGEKANGKSAELKIVEVPSDADVYLEEYDGMEHIAEYQRQWS